MEKSSKTMMKKVTRTTKMMKTKTKRMMRRMKMTKTRRYTSDGYITFDIFIYWLVLGRAVRLCIVLVTVICLAFVLYFIANFSQCVHIY